MTAAAAERFGDQLAIVDGDTRLCDNAVQARTSTVRGWESLPVFTS